MFDLLPAGLANALKSPASRRFVALALLATVGFAVWGVVGWAANPRYVDLFLDPLGLGEAEEYAAMLRQDNVPHKVTEGGANIRVPANQVARLRVAFPSRAMGLSGCGDPAAFTIGSGAIEQQLQRTRTIREQLSCTISRMDGISRAQVNVTLQEDSPFRNIRRAAKASVAVWPSRSGRITDDMVESIAFIVASAVDGLEPSNVAVINGNGGYSLQAPADGAGVGTQSTRELTVQRGIETELREKAERLLSPLMAAGEFQVQVSAKLDWTEIARRSERFDPEAQAIVREENSEVPPGAAGPGSPSYTSEQRESRYSVTVENVTVSPGSIERLGVAVIVNERAEIFGDVADPASAPIRIRQLAKIDSVVRAGVGFDETRGDVVTVTAIPFQVIQDSVMVAGTGSVEGPLLFIEMFLRPFLGLIALGLLAFLGLRVLKSPGLATPALAAPAAFAGEVGGMTSPHLHAHPVRALGGSPPSATVAPVVEDPGAAARVVKSWLQEV